MENKGIQQEYLHEDPPLTTSRNICTINMWIFRPPRSGRIPLLLVLAFLPPPSDACTTVAVSKTATLEKQATFVTHNNDAGAADDFRTAYVPPSGVFGRKKPIYKYADAYPRYVGYNRGETYLPVRNAPDHGDDAPQVPFEPLFHIDFQQTPLTNFAVNLTYGYYEQLYPMLNDAGLTMGESTCSSRIASNKPNSGNTTISQLMQVAMERCASARCAVSVMGAVAERFGFYGEEAGPLGGGEAVTIGDGEEVWVFHVLADGAEKAVWVAQRVPEGEVAVVANGFTIRGVDCGDGENFMCGGELYDAAVREGLLLDRETGEELWDGKVGLMRRCGRGYCWIGTPGKNCGMGR